MAAKIILRKDNPFFITDPEKEMLALDAAYSWSELIVRRRDNKPDTTVRNYIRAQEEEDRRWAIGTIELEGEKFQFRTLKEVDGMGLHNLIAKGGKVVVVGGRMNEQWERYSENPCFEFWTGDPKEIERRFPKGGRRNLPSNTRGVILSRFVSHSVSRRIVDEARRRRFVIMGPKNDGELAKLLDQIATEPKKKEQPMSEEAAATQEIELRRPRHGELQDWAKKHDDASKPIHEVANMLYPKIIASGIQTSITSVAQAIGTMRRKAGVYANPTLSQTLKAKKGGAREKKAPVAKPLSPAAMARKPIPDDGTESLLKMIDDLIAGISLLQDAVRRMHEQNLEYRRLEATLSELGYSKR